MKNIKKMWKVLLCTVITTLLCINPLQEVHAAANLSVSANKSRIKVGESVTFTVSVTGAGYVSVSGAASDSKVWLENSSKRYTVKATSEGSLTLDASGVIADFGSEKDYTLKDSKTVSVVAKSSVGNSGNTGNSSVGDGSTPQKPVEDNRSKENNLSSLTVSQGSLDPQFSANKTKYNIDLPGTAKEVTISAKAKDSKAKVSGTGKKSLKVGENTFNVVCTAENGSKKTYTLVFHVDEAPLVYTKLGEKNLGVVRVLNDVKAPAGFKTASTKLEGQDIDAYTNEQLNMTVAYLVDESGNKDFYIIEKGKVVSQFKKVTTGSREYIVVNAPKDLEGVSGLKQSKVKIGDLELDGWSYDDEALQNYSIVYLMNSDGKAQLYSYEATEGTLQIYTPATESNSLNTLTYVFIGTTVVAGVVAIAGFVMYFNFKKKSISAIKDYYEKKNQG